MITFIGSGNSWCYPGVEEGRGKMCEVKVNTKNNDNSSIINKNIIEVFKVKNLETTVCFR